ncbi:hypothetical protein ACGFZP_34100 [Kitasatospora sp. NPDC048239]|uniref:hypothetical protein n=1 Tax=Kitasatospora sp. NPDC048239 TaxID=3364046 RepID=UPI0037179817
MTDDRPTTAPATGPGPGPVQSRADTGVLRALTGPVRATGADRGHRESTPPSEARR